MEEDLILSKNVLTEDEIIRNYSGQALAYIGDSIFDLLIKDFFVRKTSMQTEKYHKVVTGIVKAVNQAALIEENLLTDVEVDVYKRGRNSSVHTKAKNATMGEYKKATGFEAVLGYNYMKGERERLDFFVERALNKAGYL